SLSSLKSFLIPLFIKREYLIDYHQRVPTQIDRFKLLKSLFYPIRLVRLVEQGGHSSDLDFSVKHFLKSFFANLFDKVLTSDSLLQLAACSVSVRAHYRDRIHLGKSFL
ncbi:MAG: hypothetical protein ACK5NC_04535, partial [Vibrio sp.]